MYKLLCFDNSFKKKIFPAVFLLRNLFKNLGTRLQEETGLGKCIFLYLYYFHMEKTGINTMEIK